MSYNLLYKKRSTIIFSTQCNNFRIHKANSLYPALILFSPERTSCFSFSLPESNIFFPLEYVSVDTPAVSANLARTSILF